MDGDGLSAGGIGGGFAYGVSWRVCWRHDLACWGRADLDARPWQARDRRPFCFAAGSGCALADRSRGDARQARHYPRASSGRRLEPADQHLDCGVASLCACAFCGYGRGHICERLSAGAHRYSAQYGALDFGRRRALRAVTGVAAVGPGSFLRVPDPWGDACRPGHGAVRVGCGLAYSYGRGEPQHLDAFRGDCPRRATRNRGYRGNGCVFLAGAAATRTGYGASAIARLERVLCRQRPNRPRLPVF